MKFKRWMIYLLLFLLAMVILLGAATFRAYGSGNKICRGVAVADVSLSGLTEDEAAEKLRNNMDESVFDKSIQIILGDITKEIKPSEFLASYDYEESAKLAGRYAREGSYFQRIKAAMRTWFGKKNIMAQISYDEEAYHTVLASLMHGIDDCVTDYSYVVENDNLTVTTGVPGLLPNTKTVSDAILHALSVGETHKPILFKKETRNPSEIDVDVLFDAIYAEKSDAFYTIEDGKVKMSPHVVGMTFDKNEAKRLIEAHRGYGEKFVIPLSIQKPSVTTEDIEEKLFSETIGEFSSKFNAGDVGRTKNIALASKKINGTILAPGEIFSYNDVVGERSYSEGYQTAKVYINGESVDGLGGGICQVSSTLYNAVVYANLEIVERLNHQLTVSYVPLGRDATVDYGNIDFKFKNSTAYPIKIVCTAENGVMYTAVQGYKEDKSLKVEFHTETIGHTDPPIKKIEDPTLPKGEEKIEKKGTSGYIVDTYKIVKRDNAEEERIYLSRSVYRGNIQEVRVGTGEPAPLEPTAEPSPSPTPSTELPTEERPQETPIETTEPSLQPTETEEPVEPELSDTGL